MITGRFLGYTYIYSAHPEPGEGLSPQNPAPSATTGAQTGPLGISARARQISIKSHQISSNLIKFYQIVPHAFPVAPRPASGALLAQLNSKFRARRFHTEAPLFPPMAGTRPGSYFGNLPVLETGASLLPAFNYRHAPNVSSESRL